MSSGTGGIHGGAVPNLVVNEQGAFVHLPGGAADVTTAEGMALATAALDPQALASLKALMAAKGFKLDNDHFVPDDRFGVDARPRLTRGPAEVGAGKSELDEEVSRAFREAGLPDAYNSATTPALYARLGSSAEFKHAAKAGQTYFENPTDTNRAAFLGSITRVPGTNGTNMMEVLFCVLRESIQDMNEDKKYFLAKLQDFNKMGEELSKYLRVLVDASQRISENSKGKDLSKDQVYVRCEIREFNLSGLDKNGKLLYNSDSKRVDRAALDAHMKNLEAAQETVRNKRQMASTAFQNFDQKTNQLYNMMSSVVKTMNEMRQAPIRNML